MSGSWLVHEATLEEGRVLPSIFLQDEKRTFLQRERTTQHCSISLTPCASREHHQMSRTRAPKPTVGSLFLVGGGPPRFSLSSSSSTESNPKSLSQSRLSPHYSHVRDMLPLETEALSSASSGYPQGVESQSFEVLSPL